VRTRGAFEGQMKRFRRKYRFATGALDQCSAETDILGFSGQDALRALDRDRVPEGLSLTPASLTRLCMVFQHGSHLICRCPKRNGTSYERHSTRVRPDQVENAGRDKRRRFPDKQKYSPILTHAGIGTSRVPQNPEPERGLRRVPRKLYLRGDET
jgi:hypothetical protein